MNKEFYGEDLCDSDGNCKLYHPLLTQGQCIFYNRMCELEDELKKELIEHEEFAKKCATEIEQLKAQIKNLKEDKK